MRRKAVLDRTWCWVHQVHGSRVVEVGDVPVAGPDADALVVAPGQPQQERALAVFSADCACLALASPEGAMGAVHAGWRGLVAGVVAEAVGEMRRVGATEVVAALGPCIHAECYAFGAADLESVSVAVGGDVAGRTASGDLALDLPRAVTRAVESAGARLVHDVAICTACSAEHFSHRARADTERQALVVWRP
jgi:YfiH family protein